MTSTDDTANWGLTAKFMARVWTVAMAFWVFHFWSMFKQYGSAVLEILISYFLGNIFMLLLTPFGNYCSSNCLGERTTWNWKVKEGGNSSN